MRIGVCSGFENAEVLARLGYDYFEGNFSAIASISEEAFKNFEFTYRSCPIKCEALNCFSSEIRLAGPDFDEYALSEYCRKGFSRAAALGAGIIVIGSGNARCVPQSYGIMRGLEDFKTALSVIADTALQFGLTTALEPLNSSETNIVTSLREGYALIQSLGRSDIKLTADIYHIFAGGESMDEITQCGPMLAHAHMSALNRAFPVKPEERFYTAFCDALAGVGYNGRISVEAKTSNLSADAQAAFPLMSGIFGK